MKEHPWAAGSNRPRAFIPKVGDTDGTATPFATVWVLPALAISRCTNRRFGVPIRGQNKGIAHD